MPRIKISIDTQAGSLVRKLSVMIPAAREDLLLNPPNPGIRGEHLAYHAVSVLMELISTNQRDEHLRYILKCVDESISIHQSAIRAECIRQRDQQATLPMDFNFSIERMELNHGH